MAKTKTSTVKARVWTFVLYPEDSDTQELLEYLCTDNVEGIRGIFIMHDGEELKDEHGKPLLDENGAPKVAKEHIHVMCEFPNPRTAKGVQKALCFDLRELETVSDDMAIDEKEHKARHVEHVSDRVSMYQYFLHWTFRCHKQGKKQYSESDIQLLGNESGDFLLSCSYDKENTARVLCADLLNIKASSERDLLKQCLDDESQVKFIMKNPYFVSKFIVGGTKK